MNNPWNDVFGEVPASFQARVNDTLQGLDGTAGGVAVKHKARRTGRTLLIAAVAAVLLVGSALAAVSGSNITQSDTTQSHQSFFQSLFGENGTAKDAETVYKYYSDGTIMSSYTIPGTETVAVDEDAAETLVGDYIESVDTSVCMGDYSFTIQNLVMDENGVGAISMMVENPNGLNGEDNTLFSIGMDADGDTMDFQAVLLDGSTDTCHYYACYFTPCTVLTDETVYLTMSVITTNASGRITNTETESIAILAERLPAVTFSDGDLTVSLSSVGMEITLPENDGSTELIADSIIIRSADGTEYVVTGTEDGTSVYNATAAATSIGVASWYCFNRLVDTASVTEIEIVASLGDTVLDCTLTPQA